MRYLDLCACLLGSFIRPGTKGLTYLQVVGTARPTEVVLLHSRGRRVPQINRTRTL